MTLNELLKRANEVYEYSEADKVILRTLAKEDPLGLMLALETDVLVQQGIPIAGPLIGQIQAQVVSGIS
jgi:hypothetical protein